MDLLTLHLAAYDLNQFFYLLKKAQGNNSTITENQWESNRDHKSRPQFPNAVRIFPEKVSSPTKVNLSHSLTALTSGSGRLMRNLAPGSSRGSSRALCRTVHGHIN